MILVKWDNTEKSIIRWNIQLGYQWSDFDTAVVKSRLMMEEVTQIVDLLVLSETALLPTPTGLQHLRFALIQNRPKSDNAGVLVMTQPQSMIEKFISIMSRVYPDGAHTFEKVRFFNNEATARQYIDQKKQKRRTE